MEPGFKTSESIFTGVGTILATGIGMSADVTTMPQAIVSAAMVLGIFYAIGKYSESRGVRKGSK